MPEWVEVLVVDVLFIATLIWLLAVSAWLAMVWLYYFAWRLLHSLSLTKLKNMIKTTGIFVLIVWNIARSIHLRHTVR